MSQGPLRFQQEADQLIRDIADRLDETLSDELDADIDGGVLYISLPDGGQYVINKNDHHGQIWLSSPKSGAWHFDYDENGETWRSTRHQSVFLKELLQKELSEIAGRPVTL